MNHGCPSEIAGPQLVALSPAAFRVLEYGIAGPHRNVTTPRRLLVTLVSRFSKNRYRLAGYRRPAPPSVRLCPAHPVYRTIKKNPTKKALTAFAAFRASCWVVSSALLPFIQPGSPGRGVIEQIRTLIQMGTDSFRRLTECAFQSNDGRLHFHVVLRLFVAY